MIALYSRHMLTITEAAEALGLSIARVRLLALQGRIRGAYKHGRAWVIPTDPPIVLPPPKR